MRLCVTLLVLLCTVCVGAQILNLVTIKGNQLPYLQTFDSWDNCYNYGTCYERRCDKLRSGFYNAKYQSELPSGTEIRHWWVIDTQTPSNWVINTGLPGNCDSVQTGPCYDHTQGESGGGKYLYVDASGCFGVEFELITPTIQFTNSSPTIEFWYFMYGSNIGSGYLVLEYSTDNTTSWNEIFEEIGQQQTGGGQSWLKATVDVPITPDPTDADPVEVVFRFRARTGNSFRSDLAIDDILITQDGSYPNVTTPWIDPNCTATDTCIPPSTSSTGVPFVSGSSGGGGLSDEEIAGIVIGIVGGAIALCCCLIIIIIIVLLIISPKKPPEGGSDGL